ncbi:hypothetical protein V865_005464 [Kwoniella europaea PYCC6329]|uniref:Uncharacterized protein n=1 Tax=Kwoniella europaea PYCC6329 TaxID=1423913 RepID=A0AAX4KLQ8_9TREE
MTQNFGDLFKWVTSVEGTHSHPRPAYHSDSYDDSQSDLVEKDISLFQPIIRPVAAPPITLKCLDQYSQLLELPKEARARIFQFQSHIDELKIDRITALNIFANMKQPFSASYKSDVSLFNKVEKLFIEDMEGAQALAQALEDHRLSNNVSGFIQPPQDPTVDIFKNVKTISLGSKFLERLVNSYSTGNLRRKKIMETIGHTLQPIHICLAKPLIDPMTQDGLWDMYLFQKLSPLMNSGCLLSFTSHGFWCYNDGCFPSSLDHFNIVFSDSINRSIKEFII